MYKAWHRGISPNEYRKSLISDLEFLFDLDRVLEIKQEEKIREEKIKEAMRNLKW